MASNTLENLDFVVNRSEWHKTYFTESQISGDLSPGQVLFRVDRFAFTANNISYAMAGATTARRPTAQRRTVT